MWPNPLPVHERYSRFLHRLNNELHAAGIGHLNYQLHERFPTMAPEFDIHGLHIVDVMSKLWTVRDKFGAKQAERLFYWDNQEYVQVSPEKCHALQPKNPTNGVLAFITNLRPDAQTVTVQLNLDKLGLGGQKLDVFNALTKEPITMTNDGKLSVPLGSEQWLYVWHRPVATR
jgi:hypothetical protein